MQIMWDTSIGLSSVGNPGVIFFCKNLTSTGFIEKDPHNNSLIFLKNSLFVEIA